jgi:hypothetical protein
METKIRWAKDSFAAIKPILERVGASPGLEKGVRVCRIPPEHPDLPVVPGPFRDPSNAINGYALAMFNILRENGYQPFLRNYHTNIAYTLMKYEVDAMLLSTLPGTEPSATGHGIFIVAKMR